MTDSRRSPVLVFAYPQDWRHQLADEIQYRLAHGTGNCRPVFVARDALLYANPDIPLIRPSRNAAGLSDSVGFNITPTLARALDAARAQGWSRTTYARSALHYYLFATSIYTRARNLPGSDPLHDPLNSSEND